MNKLFVGIDIADKQEFIPLSNVDFENQNIVDLKKRIAEEIKFDDANELELIFNGLALENDLQLSRTLKPNAVIHCFKKTKHYEPYEPSPNVKDPPSITRTQELFTLIAHIQINVTSRVNILQKILNEYPEFRRNLGAQAIIRDSVLFNTIHQPETIKKIAEHYPIICDAAQFIVDTIKKELARNAAAIAANLASETTNESPNSSEEENSLGASSSSASIAEAATTSRSETEDSRIRSITRQQLQDALAQLNVATNINSINSLSNIAQRNADTNTAAAPLSSSASGELISAEMFRRQMHRAFNLLSPANASSPNTEEAQPMDTSESSTPTPMNTATATTTATTTTGVDDISDSIPSHYRSHEYAEQLRTMVQMGFLNHEENLIFLNLANGNIGNAVNLLMGSMN